MVVDDSVVIRGMISRWIDAEPDMEVSASLRTGLDAVNQLDRVKPDVAVLDIEMPELDGISALPIGRGPLRRRTLPPLAVHGNGRPWACLAP